MAEAQPPRLPLAVDLDDTLLLTDTLVEGIVNALLRNPIGFILAVFALLRGRVAFKSAIFAASKIDTDALPVRNDFLEYLTGEKEAGREIVLVTATSQSIAEQVAARFGGLFAQVHGTQKDANLKGRNKAAHLKMLYPNGFVYAGDSSADLAVWSKSSGAIFAGVNEESRRKVREMGIPVEAVFENDNGGFRAWRKELRLHQWAKNLLLFVALILSGQFVEPGNWIAPILGFFLLGIAASGTYIVNDLADLSADRRHRTKRDRPFASGRLNPLVGLIVAFVLIPGALVGGFILNPLFGFGLLAYLAMTMSYSFGLKRVAMLDVFIIASLFTIRIILGAFAIEVVLSEWLLTFSMFFFLSLSFAKRHVEIAAAGPGGEIRGRGYTGDDAPLSLVFGVGSGTAAILILVLYLVEDAFPSGLYAFPEALWSAPMLIMLWIMRIWLLAHRGELDDDPVLFAVKDRISLWMGVGLGAGFFASIIPIAL